MNACGYQAVSCIDGLLNKDRETTTRLFYRITEKLSYLSYRFNASQAEEAFTEVYLKLYALKVRNPNKIQEITHCCITYMGRMASNWFIDQSKIKEDKHGELPSDGSMFIDSANSDYEHIEMLEGILEQCENELSNMQRSQWLDYKKMKYFEGKSSEEIYEKLGRSSANALDVWAHGIIKALKKCAKEKRIEG